jgi:aspartyl-tRNA(Asn)/glutamyl-tRNA(Gln) amidotransferase subunit A
MALCDHSALELARMLRRGDVSSREITQSVLDRIEQKEAILNAYITTLPEAALEQADEADRRRRRPGDLPLLTGIPVAVKDALCTRGIRTTCGSRMLRDYIPPYNATAVERLEKSGAVLLGKTNMDEFAMGSSTENSAFGPTRNPADPERVAGGSSGGSAAAVASGEAVLAVGSDTGGSIRLPAAYCGVAGIKPTYGRVSRYGLISYASSLDQVGALGRSVEDCALLLDALCGHDPRDTTSARMEKPEFLQSLDRDIRGLRIGIPKEYYVEGLEERAKRKILEAVERMEENGARVREVSLPHAAYAIGTYYLIATAEAGSNLARYDGVRYGLRSARRSRDAAVMIEETRNAGFGTEVKRRIMLGTYVLSAGYYEAYYRQAQKVRTLIKADFDRAFEDVDCMVAPVAPCLPFKLGEKMTDPLQMYLVDIYTVSLNLSGLPGLSMPCGEVDGLPVGMQIIGRPFDEETILGVGHAYETALGRP